MKRSTNSNYYRESVPLLKRLTAKVEESFTILNVNLILVSLMCFIEGADQQLLAVTKPGLVKDLGWQLKTISIFAMCNSVLLAFCAPFWGNFADRFNRKLLLIVGACGWGGCTLFLSFAYLKWHFILLRTFNGIFLAALNPISQGLIADMYDSSVRGKAFGVAHSAMFLGAIVSVIIGTPTATIQFQLPEWLPQPAYLGGVYWGWRGSRLVIGLLTFISTIVFALYFEEPVRGALKPVSVPDKKVVGTKAYYLACFRAYVSTPIWDEICDFLNYFRTPTFAILVAQGCFGSASWQAFTQATQWMEHLQYSPLSKTLINIGYFSGLAAGAYLGGYIGDIAHRILPNKGRIGVAQFSVLSGIPFALAIFTMDFFRNPDHWVYVFLLVTLMALTSQWCATGVNRPLLMEIVPERRRASILAWLICVEQSVGNFLADGLTPLIAEKWFGHKIDNDSNDPDLEYRNGRALGFAMTIMTVIPWIICFSFYSSLWWYLDISGDQRRLKKSSVSNVEA